MADYKTLREMEDTYLAAAELRVPWNADPLSRSLGLARQISILAGHLASQMIPIPLPPPCDDEHVAIGCSLFSDPTLMKGDSK